MALDAQIIGAFYNADEPGVGELLLDDRPKQHHGDRGGIAGQASLQFSNGPDFNILESMLGMNVWGGTNFLMLGEIQIAERTSPTTIKFGRLETLKQAIAEYIEDHGQPIPLAPKEQAA